MTTETFKLSYALKAKTKAQDGISLFDYFLIAGVVLSWGVAFIGIKATAQQVIPAQAAGMRFFLAALPLLFFALRAGKLKRWSRTDLLKVALLGFLQTAVVFGIIYTASVAVPAGVVAIIANTNPFFVAILAHFVLNDKLTKQKLLGLVVGFSGVVMVVSNNLNLQTAAVVAPLFILLAAVCWGSSSVLLKKFGFTDMVSVSGWQMLFGSIPLLIIGFGLDSQPFANWNWNFILWTLYTAFVASTFGWWAWFRVLQKYNASKISVYLFLVPICGVLCGALFLGEKLTYNLLFGGGLVVLGVVLVNLRIQQRTKKADE
jgi:drug/metabolite transporter (DMT)-like permease